MKKTSKKMTKTMKEDLRFLVEEFLEKSGSEITAKIVGNGDAAKTMWKQLESSLFANTFWMDEPDSRDITDSDYETLLQKYHAVLKPVWGQFRDVLFDYKYSIIPAREDSLRLLKTIDRDETSPIYEYKELLKQQDSIYSEKIFDIALKKSIKSDALRVTFDPGTVTFYRSSLDVVTNLIDLLSGVNINDFDRCDHCGKCIVLKRSDKRYCPGCAAKKHQKENWAKNPKIMRKKERERYKKRRKPNSGKD